MGTELNLDHVHMITAVLSQMTDVPDNRTSKMAEFKQTEEVYKITVFI